MHQPDSSPSRSRKQRGRSTACYRPRISRTTCPRPAAWAGTAGAWEGCSCRRILGRPRPCLRSWPASASEGGRSYSADRDRCTVVESARKAFRAAVAPRGTPILAGGNWCRRFPHCRQRPPLVRARPRFSHRTRTPTPRPKKRGPAGAREFLCRSCLPRQQTACHWTRAQFEPTSRFSGSVLAQPGSAAELDAVLGKTRHVVAL